MRHRARQRMVALAVVPVACAFLVVTAGPAAAHEQRKIGNFQVEVGWGDEPTYAGFKNSVQFILKDADDNPVTDLGDTLKVEVKSGDQTAQFPLVPNFSVGPDAEGDPGDYRAWFVPTRPGTYSFHFTGTIRGQAVDETFTSSETTFDDVADPSQIEFPAKDPTTGQLSDRLDRETTRVSDSANAAAVSASKAKDEANTARTIGVIALVVGVVALGVGAVALFRRPSSG
jgi:hypothetical protein